MVKDRDPRKGRETRVDVGAIESNRFRPWLRGMVGCHSRHWILVSTTSQNRYVSTLNFTPFIA